MSEANGENRPPSRRALYQAAEAALAAAAEGHPGIFKTSGGYRPRPGQTSFLIKDGKGAVVVGPTSTMLSFWPKNDQGHDSESGGVGKPAKKKEKAKAKGEAHRPSPETCRAGRGHGQGRGSRR